MTTATGDNDGLHRPAATFGNIVTGHRHKIKEKIFADMLNAFLSGSAATGGRQESDPPLALRRRSSGSYADATPSRSEVRRRIFAEIFKRNSVDDTAGAGITLDLEVSGTRMAPPTPIFTVAN